MLTWITGRSDALRQEISARVREALAGGDGEVLVLVPAQATLQAEKDLLPLGGENGSFRLHVASPARFYRRVFQCAGWPKEARVDLQGRVMILNAAAERLRRELRWYGSACERTGFAERVESEIRMFKQAGISFEQVAQLGESLKDTPAGLKLQDVALLYEAYEEKLSGRFMDGEDETRRAVERFGKAGFLRNASVFLYGFDLLTGVLLNLAVGLAGTVKELAVLLPCVGARERDGRLYAPSRTALERAFAQLRKQSVPFRHCPLPSADAPEASALQALANRMYTRGAKPWTGSVSGVGIRLLKDPQAEARYAAAYVRHFVRSEGCRYGEIAIACKNLDGDYRIALERAFRAAGIPLFLSCGRRADKHPLSECLLSALRAVAAGFSAGDIRTYLRSGFSPLDADECDRFVNYLEARGIRGRRLLTGISPREKTDAARKEAEALEALRRRALDPLVRLRGALKDARSARDSLTGVFRFLTEIGAQERLFGQRRILESEDLPEAAAEGVQVWNRILSALDQMADLLSEEKLTARKLAGHLTRSLSAVEVKPLPQAADAVECGEIDHVKAKGVRLLLIVGLSDREAEAGRGLLDEAEIAGASRSLDAWLRLTEEESQSLARLSLKSLLAATGERLLATSPMSDATGRALKPGSVLAEMQRILPGLKAEGGVREDPEEEELLLETASGALLCLPELLSRRDPRTLPVLNALGRLPGAARELSLLVRGSSHTVGSEALQPKLAQALFGPLDGVSASRLETFAACPFRHFVRFALRPVQFEPFSLRPRDEGTFYHSALERFLREAGPSAAAMDEDDAARRMETIARELQEADLPYLQDRALMLSDYARMRATAGRAARTAVRHLAGSRFLPLDVESDLTDGQIRISLGGQAHLIGRIDRVDGYFAEGGGEYLRIIDYKTGGRAADLRAMYNGLELQLLLYLKAAIAKNGAKPAGVFYFPVGDPLPRVDSGDREEIEKERDKQLKLDGLILNDAEIIGAMTPSPESALGLVRTSGGFRASRRLLEEADFDLLIRHATKQAESMIRRIREGETRILPAGDKQRNPCRWCECRTVCQFDERLPGARRRALPRMDQKDVLPRLREEYRQEDPRNPREG